MHILLTRPLDDCKDLILKFKSLGNVVSHLPVIEIKKKIHENIDFNQYKGIIFTSANSIKNLTNVKINKNVFFFCEAHTQKKKLVKVDFKIFLQPKEM